MSSSALDGLHAHRGLEERDVGLAALLGRVHRDVGVAAARRRRGLGPGQATPMLADGVIWRPATVSGGSSARRTRSAIASASASSTRSSSRTANSSPPRRAAVSCVRSVSSQPARGRAQQLVAGGVAEAVVDGLEVVEVDEQTAASRRCGAGARAARRQAILEQRAVGQAGEAVVEGLVAQLLEQREALGDVAHVERIPSISGSLRRLSATSSRWR